MATWIASTTRTGSAGWQTGALIDFSAEGNQTLSSDTTYSIAGITCTKQNSSSDQTSMSLVNGSGLVVVPKATNIDYSANIRTVPLLCIPLASVIPGFDPAQTAVRVLIYTSSVNYAANYDSVIVAIDSGSTALGYVCKTGYVTAGQGTARHMNMNATNPGFNGITAAAANTYNVTMVSAPEGCYAGVVNSAVGTWSNGFPAMSSMLHHMPYRPTPAYPTGGYTGLTWYASIGAQRYASATALSVAIAACRIDYRYL